MATRKEITSLLVAANSTNLFGDKYPLGNKVMTEMLKTYEKKGLIQWDEYSAKWKRK